MLLLLACCCGCPAYYGRPAWEQYPASVYFPQELVGFELRDDAQSNQTATELAQEMRAEHWFSEDTFGKVYRDPDGKALTIFGSTGFRFTPERDLDAEVSRLSEKYGMADVQEVETGERGEYQRCGTGRADGRSVVVCSWADHGSLATVLLTGRSVDESATLVGEVRDTILQRGGSERQ